MANKTNEMNSRERRAAARAATGISTPQTPTNTNFLNIDDIKDTITQVVEKEFNLVLETLIAKGSGPNRTLEITIDYAEGTDSLSLDTVAEVSQAISTALDTIDDGETPYLLEVSSPGASRPLTEERHWKRAIGRLIDITPADGTEKYLARLHDVTPEGPLLARKKNTKKGQKESYQDPTTTPWDIISTAKVEIEFNQ